MSPEALAVSWLVLLYGVVFVLAPWFTLALTGFTVVAIITALAAEVLLG